MTRREDMPPDPRWNLVLAAAEADEPFAADLERALASRCYFATRRRARVSDAASLAALNALDSGPHDRVVFVVVSRALVAGMRSLVEFDEALGQLELRQRCFLVVRSGNAAPPAEAESIWKRRRAVQEASTAADLVDGNLDLTPGWKEASATEGMSSGDRPEPSPIRSGLHLLLDIVCDILASR